MQTGMLRLAARALQPPLSVPSASCSRSRRYHNLSDARSSPSPELHSKKRARVKDDVPALIFENRCALVRTWEFLRNTAEAFAVIRAVEQKYGPIEYFSFQKDFDDPSVYQTHVKVTFRDMSSFNRIPEDFETLHIRAPKVEPKRPGGIALEEIHPLISDDVEFLTADQVSEMSSERTIDFRVERAQRAYYSESPYRFTGKNHQLRRTIATRMLQWGGFHEMQPIDSRRTITNEELTNGTLDHVHMRRSLREWADYIGVKNPFEIYPEGSPKGEGLKRVARKKFNAGELDSNVVEEMKLEEWEPLDVGEPEETREPFQKIMELEDTEVTVEAAAEPARAKGSSAEDTPMGKTDAMSPSTSKSGGTEDSTIQVTAEPLTIHEANSLLISDLISPVPRPTGEPRPSSSLPHSTGAQKPEADRQELQAQLDEARRIATSTKSFQVKKKQAMSTQEMRKRREKLKEPPREEMKKEVKEELNNVDLEPNPRFKGLFSRLQDIFKG